MTLTQQIITIALCALGTMATRFLPFLLFSSRKPTPGYIRYVGNALPAAIFGMLVVYFVNYLIRNHLGDTTEAIQTAMVSIGWRRMFLSEAFPAATFFLLILLVPETPRHLTLTGHDEQALKVLTRINGAAEARAIHDEIRQTVHEKTERLFAYGTAVIVIGVLLSFFQQAIGINVVLYYAPRIFENMGASGDASMLQTVVMGIVNIVFTVVAIFTVDKVGRRPLLIIGSVGMMIGMTALAILSSSTPENP